LSIAQRGQLFGLVVRPTPRFVVDKLAIYRERVLSKQWAQTWPNLQIQHRGQTPFFGNFLKSGSEVHRV
jgi:hypothetical protein